MLSAMVDDLLGHNRNEDGSSELHWSAEKACLLHANLTVN